MERSSEPGIMAHPGHPQRAGWQQQLGHSCPGHGSLQDPGAVKGRDRHRVTSAAALLMGLAVSQSQHPQNSAHQPALLKVPSCCLQLSLDVTAAAHPSRGSGGIPQTAAAAWGRDGWGKPVQPLSSLQCRTGEGSLGSRLLADICVCAHHGTLTSTALLAPARALRPAAHMSDEFMYSLCSADAGPGMFPYRDVSSLDKTCTLTFEVNNLQVGILFLQRKPFPSLPTTKTGLPVCREATLECLEILHVHTHLPVCLGFWGAAAGRSPHLIKQCFGFSFLLLHP